MKQMFLVFGTVIFLLSCQNQPASKWETMKFIYDTPSLTHINLGDSAVGHGDGLAWEAPFRDTLGNIVGTAYGFVITIDMMDGDSANPSHVIERTGTTIFDFGDENEIIGESLFSFHNGQKRLKVGLSQVFPVVGGTGKYKGVEGEFSVTRQSDSTNVYLFNIKRSD